MTLGEKSHGKARPRLVRSSDLTVASSVPERTRQRDASGRFASGNSLAIGRGAKAAVRRLLGRGLNLSDPEALAVARDADRLYGATLAELPHDGPTVRQLVALYARHVALSAFWSARASTAGLGSDDGVIAAEHSTKHGQRAERLAISMLDIANTQARAAAERPVTSLAEWSKGITGRRES